MSSKFELTIVSAKTFLSQYEDVEEDDKIEDPISLVTQKEFFQESKLGMKHWKPIKSITELLMEIPLICRTLYVHLPLSKDPWFGSIISMPTVLKKMNTSDFLTKFKNKTINQETINAAMLVTNHPNSFLSTKAGKHVSSFLLSSNSNKLFYEADLACWAMTVNFIFTRPEIFSWMYEELSNIQLLEHYVYDHMLNTSWHKYKTKVKSLEFKHALVSFSSRLDPSIQCPHLNKFLFAVFAVHQTLSDEELEERRDACICEFYGRQYNTSRFDNFQLKGLQKTIEKQLQDCDFCLKPTELETLLDFKSNLQNFQTKRTTLVNQVTLPNRITYVHQNLNCELICNFFSKLRSTVNPLTPTKLAMLLHRAISIKDSFQRNVECGNQFTITLSINNDFQQKIQSHVRRKLFMKSAQFVHVKFNYEMAHLHRDMPLIFTDENIDMYDRKYSTDLRQKFNVNSNGLSRNCCMCSKCPFFGKPLFSENSNANKFFIKKGNIAQHWTIINAVIFEVVKSNLPHNLFENDQNDETKTVKIVLARMAERIQTSDIYIEWPFDCNAWTFKSLLKQCNESNATQRTTFFQNNNLINHILQNIEAVKKKMEWENFEKLVTLALSNQQLCVQL
jgi:hypothetical protein